MRRLVTLLLVIPLLGAVVAPTAAQAPTTTEELLSGMITEEVGPGIYKVVNDGRRDRMPAYFVRVGTDGSVWGLREQGFFRLGGKFTKWPRNGGADAFEVTPDGTVWAIWYNFTLNDPKKGKDVIRTFDGERWKTRKTFPVNGYGGLEVTPDGTVLGWWPDPKDTGRWPAMVVARYGADGWQRLFDPIANFMGLHAGSGDDVWVMYEGEDRKEYLRQFADGEWTAHEMPVSPDGWDVGADGTVWAKRLWEWRTDDDGEPVLDDEGNVITDYENTLVRYDGDGWQEFGPDDGIPDTFVGLKVAPDGSVWGESHDGDEATGTVLRFDGTTWTQFLPGIGGHFMEFGPDGSVWLLGGDGDMDEGKKPYDLYVITPEAVAE